MATPWGDAWPVVLLFLALVGVAVFSLMRTLRRQRQGRIPAEKEKGPVPLPPEEAELVEGPVWACMRCGSTEVGMGSVLQGQIPGAGDQFSYVCRRCRHRGPPLEFESVTAYRQFVKGLRGEPDREKGP